MRLIGSDLACRRGGREVFAGLNFSVAAGEALTVTGRNGAGKSSLLRLICGLLRIARGRLAIEGGDDELTIGEQAHYLGHLDALKPSLSVAENLRFWAGYLGDGTGDLVEPLAAVGLDRSPTCRPLIFRRGKSGGCRLRASSPSSARFGCSTSRPARSMSRRKRGSRS